MMFYMTTWSILKTMASSDSDLISSSDIIYEPGPQVRVIPAAIALSLTMAVGTFFVSFYNVGGFSENRSYSASIFFGVCTVLFVRFYVKLKRRYTFGADGITVEKLYFNRKPTQVIQYSEIGRIDRKVLKPKLVIYSKEGRVLLKFPDIIRRVHGELADTVDRSEPAPLAGIWREHHLLRNEILRRAGHQIVVKTTRSE